MKKSILFFIAFSLTISSVQIFAQENIGKQLPKVISPEVGADNSVIFNIIAPEARSVTVTGNWMTQTTSATPEVAMTKDNNRVWSVKQTNLPSDLYLYNFMVDGVKINDPLNVYQIRDVNNVFNYFITNGEPA